MSKEAKKVMTYLFYAWVATMMAIVAVSAATIIYYTFCNEFYALS